MQLANAVWFASTMSSVFDEVSTITMAPVGAISPCRG